MKLKNVVIVQPISNMSWHFQLQGYVVLLNGKWQAMFTKEHAAILWGYELSSKHNAEFIVL